MAAEQSTEAISSDAARNERMRRVLDLRKQRLSFRAIAAELNCSPGTAFSDFQAGMRLVLQETAAEAKNLELHTLDDMQAAAEAVLRAHHVVVSQGRVVSVDEVPVTDHEPVLRSIATILRIQERRAKLLGLDSPAQQEVTVTQVDATDLEVMKLVRRMEERNSKVEASLRGEPA